MAASGKANAMAVTRESRKNCRAPASGASDCNSRKQIALEQRRNSEHATVLSGNDGPLRLLQHLPHFHKMFRGDERLIGKQDGDGFDCGIELCKMFDPGHDRRPHTGTPTWIFDDGNRNCRENHSHCLRFGSDHDNHGVKSYFDGMCDRVLHQRLSTEGQQLLELAHSSRAACRQNDCRNP